MKKALLYVAIAMILGLVMTLSPLVVLANMNIKNHRAGLCFLTEDSGKIYETPYIDKESLTDLGVLAFCFIIAFIVYSFVKSKTRLEQDYRWRRHYLY